MKSKMATREDILQILQEKGAVLQKDLWKELSIDSSKCSRILRKLEREGLIKRVEVVVDGVKTFKIIPANMEIKEIHEEDNLKIMMEKVKDLKGLPPCFGCLEKNCDAISCIKLEAWLLKNSKNGKNDVI